MGLWQTDAAGSFRSVVAHQARRNCLRRSGNHGGVGLALDADLIAVLEERRVRSLTHEVSLVEVHRDES